MSGMFPELDLPLLDQTLPMITMAEYSGKGIDRNPNSSASGAFQYTDGTWNNVVKQYGQRYGLTTEGRNDPAQQALATRVLAVNEYLPYYASRGVKPDSLTPADIYQMHFWGQNDLDKLLHGADAGKTASEAFGDRWKSIYRGNAGVFGGDPNISAGDAYQAVRGYFSGKSGMRERTVPARASYAVPDTQQDPQGPTDATQGPPTMPDFTSPQAIAQQTPGNTGGLSQQALLRMAQGFAGKQTFGEALSGGAGGLAAGMDSDSALALKARGLDVEQQNADSMQARNRTGAMEAAGKFMEMGVPPQQAMQMAMAGLQGTRGGAPADPMAGIDLSKVQAGGRATQGEAWYGPGSNPEPFMVQSRPFGPPIIRSMATGQVVQSLPEGSTRGPDSAAKLYNTGDAKAYESDLAKAKTNDETLRQNNAVLDLLPQISSGTSLGSVIQRNASQLLGVKIGETDPDAVNLASTLFKQLDATRMKALAGSGLGRVTNAEVGMVKQAGAGWANNPTTAKIVLDWNNQEIRAHQQMLSDWQEQSSADPKVAAQGYQRFTQAWTKAHRMPAPDTAQITGRPSANDTESAGKRPPLSGYWGTSKE